MATLKPSVDRRNRDMGRAPESKRVGTIRAASVAVERLDRAPYRWMAPEFDV
jgi:hypothetical protein